MMTVQVSATGVILACSRLARQLTMSSAGGSKMGEIPMIPATEASMEDPTVGLPVAQCEDPKGGEKPKNISKPGQTLSVSGKLKEAEILRTLQNETCVQSLESNLTFAKSEQHDANKSVIQCSRTSVLNLVPASASSSTDKQKKTNCPSTKIVTRSSELVPGQISNTEEFKNKAPTVIRSDTFVKDGQQECDRRKSVATSRSESLKPDPALNNNKDSTNFASVTVFKNTTNSEESKPNQTLNNLEEPKESESYMVLDVLKSIELTDNSEQPKNDYSESAKTSDLLKSDPVTKNAVEPRVNETSVTKVNKTVIEGLEVEKVLNESEVVETDEIPVISMAEGSLEELKLSVHYAPKPKRRVKCKGKPQSAKSKQTSRSRKGKGKGKSVEDDYFIIASDVDMSKIKLPVIQLQRLEPNKFKRLQDLAELGISPSSAKVFRKQLQRFEKNKRRRYLRSLGFYKYPKPRKEKGMNNSEDTGTDNPGEEKKDGEKAVPANGSFSESESSGNSKTSKLKCVEARNGVSGEGGSMVPGEKTMPVLTPLKSFHQPAGSWTGPNFQSFQKRPPLLYKTPHRLVAQPQNVVPKPQPPHPHITSLPTAIQAGCAQLQTPNAGTHQTFLEDVRRSRMLAGQSPDIPAIPPVLPHTGVIPPQGSPSPVIKAECVSPVTPVTPPSQVMMASDTNKKPESSPPQDRLSTTPSASPQARSQLPPLTPLKRVLNFQSSDAQKSLLRAPAVPHSSPSIAHSGKSAGVWVKTEERTETQNQQEVTSYASHAYSAATPYQGPLNLARPHSLVKAEPSTSSQALSSTTGTPMVLIPSSIAKSMQIPEASLTHTSALLPQQLASTSATQPPPQFCLVISNNVQGTSAAIEGNTKAQGSVWHPVAANPSQPDSQMRQVVLQTPLESRGLLAPQPVSSSSCLASLLKAGVPLVPVTSVLTLTPTGQEASSPSVVVSSVISTAPKQCEEKSEPPCKKRREETQEEKQEEGSFKIEVKRKTEFSSEESPKPKSKKNFQEFKRLSGPKSRKQIPTNRISGFKNDVKSQSENVSSVHSEGAATSVVTSITQKDSLHLHHQNEGKESGNSSGHQIKDNKVSVISRASASISQPVVSVSQAGHDRSLTNSTDSSSVKKVIEKKSLSGKDILAIQKLVKSKNIQNLTKSGEECEVGIRSSIIQKAGKVKGSGVESEPSGESTSVVSSLDKQVDKLRNVFMEVHKEMYHSSNSHFTAVRMSTAATTSAATPTTQENNIDGRDATAVSSVAVLVTGASSNPADGDGHPSSWQDQEVISSCNTSNSAKEGIRKSVVVLERMTHHHITSRFLRLHRISVNSGMRVRRQLRTIDIKRYLAKAYKGRPLPVLPPGPSSARLPKAPSGRCIPKMMPRSARDRRDRLKMSLGKRVSRPTLSQLMYRRRAESPIPLLPGEHPSGVISVKLDKIITIRNRRLRPGQIKFLAQIGQELGRMAAVNPDLDSVEGSNIAMDPGVFGIKGAPQPAPPWSLVYDAQGSRMEIPAPQVHSLQASSSRHRLHPQTLPGPSPISQQPPTAPVPYGYVQYLPRQYQLAHARREATLIPSHPQAATHMHQTTQPHAPSGGHPPPHSYPTTHPHLPPALTHHRRVQAMTVVPPSHLVLSSQGGTLQAAPGTIMAVEPGGARVVSAAGNAVVQAAPTPGDVRIVSMEQGGQVKETVGKSIPAEYSRYSQAQGTRVSPPPPLTFMGSGGAAGSTRDQLQPQVSTRPPQPPPPPRLMHPARPAPPPLSYMGSGGMETGGRQVATSWGQLSERELAARGFRVVAPPRQSQQEVHPHYWSTNLIRAAPQSRHYYQQSQGQPHNSQSYRVVSQHGMVDHRVQQLRQQQHQQQQQQQQDNHRMRVMVAQSHPPVASQTHPANSSQNPDSMVRSYQMHPSSSQGQVTNNQGNLQPYTIAVHRGSVEAASAQPAQHISVHYQPHTAAVHTPHSATTQPPPAHATTGAASAAHATISGPPPAHTSATLPPPPYTLAVQRDTAQTTINQSHQQPPATTTQPPPAHITVTSSVTFSTTHPPPAHTTSQKPPLITAIHQPPLYSHAHQTQPTDAGVTQPSASSQSTTGASNTSQSSAGPAPRQVQNDTHTCKLACDKGMMAAVEALVLQLVDIGLPPCQDTITTTVMQLFNARGSPRPFCCTTKEQAWNQEFRSAHSHRLPEDTEAKELVLPSASEVRKWLHKLKDDLIKFSDAPPNRVFFMQELNFFLDKQTREVKFHRMFPGGIHHCSNEKDTISVLFVLGANGVIGPGMVIFPRMVIPEKLFASLRQSKAGKEWVLGSSLNGWLYSDCVMEFVSDAFVPWLKKHSTHFPVALFTNEYVSNLSLARMSDTFREQGIQLVTVPRKIATSLSPAEGLVADYFRQQWGQAVWEWRTSNDNKPLLEENFTPFLLSCLAAQASQDKVTQRFISSGICPFNSQAMFHFILKK